MTEGEPVDLPDDIDLELWLPCRHHPGARDYLYPAVWPTFPGRMGAYCVTRKVYFRLSKTEIPDDAALATKYWVAGFLAGNLPRPPSTELEGDDLERWRERAEAFFKTGRWQPVERTDAGWLSIKLRAEDGANLSAMVEPIGQIYELSSGDCMFADGQTHNDESSDTLEIISTPGLISIWPPGHVQTRDDEGNDLHWLN